MTSAGDRGAINVWRDSDGRLRAARYAYRVKESDAILPTLQDLSAWLHREWPMMGKID